MFFGILLAYFLASFLQLNPSKFGYSQLTKSEPDWYFEKTKLILSHLKSSNFILFATNSNGIIKEFKIPREDQGEHDYPHQFEPKAFRMGQPKFTKVFQILINRSFNLEIKLEWSRNRPFENSGIKYYCKNELPI